MGRGGTAVSAKPIGFGLPDPDRAIAEALAEDLGITAEQLLSGAAGGTAGAGGAGAGEPAGILARDVTTSATLPSGEEFAGAVVARAEGVVCGLPVAERVFSMLAAVSGSEPVDVFPLVSEGAHVEAGDAVLEVSGPAAVVLAGERTALDFVMVLSGIATAAAAWQRAAGPSLAVCDTRKTLPGLRALSKYAVRVGGATNHRAGLWDMVLVKDNHIVSAGGITAAVAAARAAHPDLKVQVEADTIDQAEEAAGAGADLVLLDNFAGNELLRAVQTVHRATPEGHRVLIEASGGVTIDRLAVIAAAGCDRASTSALTLAPPLDFGLDAL
jgi:nicotinate-nucleotide pyrophosphorylase (carboxylating)